MSDVIIRPDIWHRRCVNASDPTTPRHAVPIELNDDGCA